MTGPFKIGTLARLTGFSPALLRAWERRYALLSPERGTGGQRLYSDEDLVVLRRVRAFLEEGRSIGEIAGIGRQRLLDPATGPTLATSAAGGPPDVPAIGAAAWRRRIVRAAQALDSREVAAALDEVFGILPAERAIADVIEPVALEIGQLWEAGRCSVAGEHLVSDQFLHRVHRLLDAAQPLDEEVPRVVAACLPDEEHQLGLAIFSWQLARRALRVTYLGAGIPVVDLLDACRTSRPAAVVLSVTRWQVFEAHYASLVECLSAELPGIPAFIGGQGIPEGFGDMQADGQVFCVRELNLPVVVDRVVAAARQARTAHAVVVTRREHR